MSGFLQDLKFALRQLAKSPGFAITVIVTVGLGIGANTAIFTLFDQVLLRMLPVQRPQELVRFRWTGGYSGSANSFGGDISNYFSYPMYKDLRDQNKVFAGLVAADRTNVGISWNNQAEDKEAEVVTGNYFQVLGLRPAAGRLFNQADEGEPGANPVVVLSYAYWKAHFAGDRGVIGQTLLVNGHPFTIVGVAPQGFASAIGGYQPGVFVPIGMEYVAMPQYAPREDLKNHQALWLTLFGRLKPGESRAQAQAGLGPLWHSLRAQELTLYKNASERFRTRFMNSQLSVLDDSQGYNPGRVDLKTPLIILMSMAGLLAALCAINVATLLLLRAAGRAREMSMRYALGARRSRVVSQLLVEGGLLGLGGALAGVAMAPTLAQLLVRLMTNADPGTEPYSAVVDGRILLFSLLLSIVVSLLFSIAPVLHFLSPNLAIALRQNAGTSSKGSQLFRKVAVGAQIALSVMLLAGAGLFVRTLENLRHQKLGLEAGRLITFSLDPTSSGYGDDRTAQVVSSAIEALEQIPGVAMVSATTDPELGGNNTQNNYTVQGHKRAEDEDMTFESEYVTADYSRTLGQPLLAGREISTSDQKGAPKVAVVNLTLAKRYFGSADNALGHSIAAGEGDTVKLDTVIVGVVGDVLHADLRSPIKPTVYAPYLQMEHPVGVAMYVRTSAAPETVMPAIRQAIHRLDATLVVDGLRTMDQQVDQIAADERTLAVLAMGFAGLATVLSAVGLYGVLAYSTQQRTREIGVRLALGSPRLRVVTLVAREMLWIALAAAAVGLPAAVALARLFKSQLFGVATFDPLVLASAVGLTAAMVVVASALPARRAASVQPIVALRAD